MQIGWRICRPPILSFAVGRRGNRRRNMGRSGAMRRGRTSSQVRRLRVGGALLQSGEPVRRGCLLREARRDEIRVALGKPERGAELVCSQPAKARRRTGEVAVNGVVGADDLPHRQAGALDARASPAASRRCPVSFHGHSERRLQHAVAPNPRRRKRVTPCVAVRWTDRTYVRYLGAAAGRRAGSPPRAILKRDGAPHHRSARFVGVDHTTHSPLPRSGGRVGGGGPHDQQFNQPF